MMSLAKQHFAKLRAFPKNNTCLNHALAVIWCASFLPVAWSGAAKVCYLLLLLASGDGLLLAGLLLLVQLLSLSFSSWTCCWTLVLLLLGLVLSFNPPSWFCWGFWCDAVQELVLFLGVVCKNCGVLVRLQCWTCECCSPGDTHLVDCLALLAAVVLPALASSSVTKLLVSCVLVYSLSLV
jgi:hypothetical protein